MKVHRGNFQSNITFLKKSHFFNDTSQRVLEIGSGNGTMCFVLKKLGYSVIGTEVNQDYIRRAKDLFAVDLVSVSEEQLPFETASFDAVVSFDVFEHIPDSKKHLSEVYRVLKPGGRYFFTTPNKYLNVPFEIIKERSITKWKTYHCSVKSLLEVSWLCRSVGFQVAFCSVPAVNEFFKTKLRTYIGNWSLAVLKFINPDKFPLFLRTNLYVVARKS